jgi:peptidoglycan/LPS O-acetylase OafA/YrhL
MNKLSFRKEITSLRAFAIIPVILYHLDISLFKSGYLGVDVFFVLSGYLISHKIIYDMKTNNFKFSTFYLGRIKRLFPALLFLILIINFISIKFYIGSDLNSIFNSSLYSLAYLSNFYFLNNTNYFDTELSSQLYLHTWSLSIEEQFYIFMPLFLYFLIQKKINNQKIYVLLILILSYLSAVFLPVQYFSYKFYLLPFRIWEFLIGTLVAFYLLNYESSNKFNNTKSAFLLVVIILQFIIPYNSLNHPGWTTIVTCLATALLLVYIQKAHILNQIVNFRVFYFFGLISYSLYLWHDPIIKLNKKLNLVDNEIFLFLVITVVSSLSYYLVENYFRHKASNYNFFIFNTLIILMILITVGYKSNQSTFESSSNKSQIEVDELNIFSPNTTSTTLQQENDTNETITVDENTTSTTLQQENDTNETITVDENEDNKSPNEYDEKLFLKKTYSLYFDNKLTPKDEVKFNVEASGTVNYLENLCFITGYGYEPSQDQCLIGHSQDRNNILFLGDSTAHNYYMGMKNYLDSNGYDKFSLNILAVTGCVPFIENYEDKPYFLGKEEKCEKAYIAINEILNNYEFDTVFVSYRYKYFYEYETEDFIFADSYTKFENKLIELNKKTDLYIIGPSVLLTEKSKDINQRNLSNDQNIKIFTNDYIDLEIFEIHKEIKQRMLNNNINYVPLLDYLCEKQYCINFIQREGIFYLYLRDKIHLTQEASILLAENLFIKYTSLDN